MLSKYFPRLYRSPNIEQMLKRIKQLKQRSNEPPWPNLPEGRETAEVLKETKPEGMKWSDKNDDVEAKQTIIPSSSLLQLYLSPLLWF